MMVTFGQRIQVEFVQNAGTPDEKKSFVEVGGNLNDTALFQADVMPQIGDEINYPGSPEPRVVTDVAAARAGGRVTHYVASLVSKSKYERPGASTPSVQQIVHGDVGQMAGRDINIRISAAELIAVLQNAVEQDDTLPKDHKSSILDRIKQLADNPYFQRISSSLVSKGLWAALGGGGEP